MLSLSIVGQDTLAKATRECCSRHFNVTQIPVCECRLLWVCYDVPLEEQGQANYDKVLQWIADDINAIIAEKPAGRQPPLVLISSQLPVGTVAKFEKGFPGWAFAYQPENIRVATAVADFESQARVIIGRRDPKNDQLLADLFAPFTKRVIFTDPETAEMTKHVLNTYLGMSIAFANEMAMLCKAVGADPDTITEALRSDARVSPKAPLKAGGPFGGGHLARDIRVLNELAYQHRLAIPLISHIAESNGGLH